MTIYTLSTPSGFMAFRDDYGRGDPVGHGTTEFQAKANLQLEIQSWREYVSNWRPDPRWAPKELDL